MRHTRVFAGAALGLTMALATPEGPGLSIARTPENELPVLQGPYLGQQAPGMKPGTWVSG